MLPNYVPLGWPRNLSQGSDLDQFFMVKMGKILRNVLDGVNPLSYQCRAEECCYAT